MAKICLMHSFMIPDIKSEITKWDVTLEEEKFMEQLLMNCEYDYYDKLIQLCDSLATHKGICILETRFVDVTRRYGTNDYTIPR